MIRYAILGLLRAGATRHGYALLKEYRRLTGSQLSVGNIYRELQRLLADGLIQTMANPPGADPRRTPYRITPAGASAFDAWLATPRNGTLADYQDEMSLRACLVVQSKDSPVGPVLDRWRDELAIRRSAFERERLGAVQSGNPEGPDRFDAIAVLAGRRLKHLSVDLEFVEELRSAYGAWANGGRAGARAQRGRPRSAPR